MDRTTQALIEQYADPIQELGPAIKWLCDNKRFRDDKGYAGKYAIFQIKVIGRLKSLQEKYVAAAKKEIAKCPDLEIKELLLSAVV